MLTPLTTNKWDARFIDLAEHVAGWSKDPGTKCGCVIVRADRTVAAVGYNGFPRNMSDDPALYADRPEKLSRTVHAELNALLSLREPVVDFTAYIWPLMPCERCAVHLIQAGIIRVVSVAADAEAHARWGDALAKTEAYFNEAGVEWVKL